MSYATMSIAGAVREREEEIVCVCVLELGAVR